MAEAFMRRYASDRFDAYSAGLEPKGINRFTLAVRREAGIAMEGQYSKSLTEYLGKLHFGYLITVCGDADERCPSTFPGMGQRLHWAFKDPAAFDGPEEETLAKFREVWDQIEARIRAWLAEVGVPT
jgi:arsenate reductase